MRERRDEYLISGEVYNGIEDGRRMSILCLSDQPIGGTRSLEGMIGVSVSLLLGCLEHAHGVPLL
jgi:hypothetical protein